MDRDCRHGHRDAESSARGAEPADTAMPPQLIEKDLLLRPFAATDAPAFVGAARESVESVGRWLPWCVPGYGEDDALRWFAHCERERWQGDAFAFGVFDRRDGQLLGGAGLNRIAHDHHFANLGYWVRRSRQGQGIATACTRSLAAFGFGTLGLSRVEIVVAVGNQASIAVARKAGALHEGIARNRLHLHGRAHDAHMFSLVPDGKPGAP